MTSEDERMERECVVESLLLHWFCSTEELIALDATNHSACPLCADAFSDDAEFNALVDPLRQYFEESLDKDDDEPAGHRSGDEPTAREIAEQMTYDPRDPYWTNCN
jgi:hypothetical protein